MSMNGTGGKKPSFLRKLYNSYKGRHVNAWILFLIGVYAVVVIKFVTFKEINNNTLFAAYSIAVSFYILSRFGLAYFYDPSAAAFDPNYQPTVSFAVPAKNEGENIRETILRIAQVNYPKDKFDIIAVNDGSDDETLKEMWAAQRIAKQMGVAVHVTNWKTNKGKREGMAECVRQSSNEILIFIDSDSFVDSEIANELTKYFIDRKVGAVAGHAYVANENTNLLTKMQAVRYFVAFKAYKASEALFGSVTCCSGCCSAYRKEYVLAILDNWLNQQFLGIQCTYGDDRALTNDLLKQGYTALFSPTAIASTFVPDTFQKFMKQQLRWKKSWFRENLRASMFMFKKNPIMSISFYLGVVLPLLAPAIVLRAVIYPLASGIFPLAYLAGLLLMAFVYGMYYYIYTNDRKWVYGVLFATFYTLILVWQLPYAILNIRDARWGTR